MKNSLRFITTILPLLILLVTASCNNNNTKKATPAKADTGKKTIAETVTKKVETATEKPATINIMDTLTPKLLVLCMKDSAATMERIGLKLGKIYSVKLAEVLKKNNMKASGPPMAWYKGAKAPFFFEAGIPLAKRPSKIPANVFVKELTSDSAVVAHFYGPYTLLYQGYDALKEWMKDEKKKPTSAPFEIYVDNAFDSTGKPIDPYKIRTDIVFPHN
jgi:effector-binding domain-containing protein